MKYLCKTEDFIKEQKESQKKCLEMIGKGKFSIEFIEKKINELKNINETLRLNCKTTIKIKTTTCGGTCEKIKVPTITQSQLYKDNQFLISKLLSILDIAKFNDLQFVIDFSFTDEQLLKYCKMKNFK